MSSILSTSSISFVSAAAFFGFLAKYLWSLCSRETTITIEGNAGATVRALPSNWYSSADIYELERRAIFSKKWILVTHKLRLTDTGSWLRIEEAGFPFLLVRIDDGEIRGFLNKCRHGVSPLASKEQGQLSELVCKCQGNNDSSIDVQAFDGGNHGLLPIHVHVDAKGFVWVNLNASKQPEAWSAEFKGIDQLSRHEPFNFDDYHFDHTWGMTGDYNWKTLADNYNECYHCKTAHPDVGAVADLTAYRVEAKGGKIEHFPNTSAEQEKQGMKIVSNYYFPNSCMTVSPHFFYIMRCVPTSALHCSMEYEVYRHNDANNDDFKRIDEMFKRILNEDKWLCNNAQRNLNGGVFVNGEMHSRMEEGPLYFQSRIRQILNEQHRLERVAKRVD